MTKTDTLSVYDKTAEEYERVISDWHDPGLKEFIAALPTGSHVLDLGCGPGIASEQMVAAGLKVDACDGSAEMVRLANQRLGVVARQALFDDIAGEAVYDGIWASFSLLHAPKASFPRHLAALHQAARPGARFQLGMKLGQGESLDDLDRFYAYYTQPELEDLLAQAGFSIQSHVTGQSRGMSAKLSDWIAITAHA
jgi:SAM-dependent methyltransferase